MNDQYRNYHDFYSRTYPKYEGYCSREQERDLKDMIETIYNNRNVEFKDTLYFQKNGELQPDFQSGVLCAVSESMSSEASVIIVDVVNQALCAPEVKMEVAKISYEVVQTPAVICAISEKIDITEVHGDQDQYQNYSTVMGYIDGDI